MSLAISYLHISTVCYLHRSGSYVGVAGDNPASPDLYMDYPNFLSDPMHHYRFRLHFYSTESLITPTAAIVETERIVGSTRHYFMGGYSPLTAVPTLSYPSPESTTVADGRTFGYTQAGYDVMLTEYTDNDETICTQGLDVVMQGSPCWFNIYPSVTAIPTLCKRSTSGSGACPPKYVHIRSKSGLTIGIQKGSVRPVVGQSTGSSQEIFIQTTYEYRMGPKLVWYAKTFYNPASQRYLVNTRTKDDRVVISTKLMQRFAWNNIERTHLADERFFIFQKPDQDEYITLRAHEDPDLYVRLVTRSINRDLLSVLVLANYNRAFKEDYLFKIIPALQSDEPKTTRPPWTRPPLSILGYNISRWDSRWRSFFWRNAAEPDQQASTTTPAPSVGANKPPISALVPRVLPRPQGGIVGSQSGASNQTQATKTPPPEDRSVRPPSQAGR